MVVGGGGYSVMQSDQNSFFGALTRHLGIKIEFQTKYVKEQNVRIFIMMILIVHNIIRNNILTKSSIKTQFFEFLVV